MRSATTFVGLWAFVLLAAWGCSKAPSSSSSAQTVSWERYRALEAKVARLEEDFRVASAARDQYRAQAVTLERSAANSQRELEQLRAALKLAQKEKEDWRIVVRTRTAERDALQMQLQQVQQQFLTFRKELRERLEQMEQVLNAPLDASIADGVHPRSRPVSGASAASAF